MHCLKGSKVVIIIIGTTFSQNNFEDKDGKPLNFINNDGFVGEKGESVSALNYAVPVLLGAPSIAGVVATLKALA